MFIITIKHLLNEHKFSSIDAFSSQPKLYWMYSSQRYCHDIGNPIHQLHNRSRFSSQLANPIRLVLLALGLSCSLGFNRKIVWFTSASPQKLTNTHTNKDRTIAKFKALV